MGQTRQRATNNGAAHSKNLTQRFFAQLGARRQSLFENGLKNMRVNDIVLSSGATGLTCPGGFLEGLQLFVHEVSCGIAAADEVLR